MACPRCEAVPTPIVGMVSVYLWPPAGHGVPTFTKILETGGPVTRHEASGALLIEVTSSGLDEVMSAAENGLSSEERRGARLLILPQGEAPSGADCASVLTLAQAIARQRAGWLLDLIRGQSLEASLHPIVYADNTQEVFALESRARGRTADGNMMTASDMFELAASADVLFQLDRAARLAAIAKAKTDTVDLPLVINFSPASIYDPRFCLRTTVAAIDDAGIPAGDIIFSIVNREHGADVPHLANILSFYREHGFRVSLGLVGAHTTSLDLLQALKPDLVFLDKSIVGGVRADAYKGVIARKMLEIAQRLNIETVASGVDGPEDARWLYEHGGSYLQGSWITSQIDADNLPALSATG